MYLLENTGEFVRSNELQEGDFIVIYSDVKSGKYVMFTLFIYLTYSPYDCFRYIVFFLLLCTNQRKFTLLTENTPDNSHKRNRS
ncbi:hypothetical protein PVAP13_4NG077257 [Panicum virgatum]|uniref:Uncharacterized protein n=1 Tax=Panicum virgatum TaxID=38727 RepID=A0A8T0PEH6_PANVG|nr:hypothetical protein PVAP13_8KG297436 [Panicum virgatum]KAG2605406.1 hypothetical protein PVAP13_4NG077257 [Panicum virgatum]